MGEVGTPGKFTPIGVFWDIENCCVPKWRSALWVVQKIRTKFFQGHREVEFMCVCDTSKENKMVIQELNSAQVNVVHIDAISKNAADDKLRQNIRRFADIYSPPATIVLISSDVNFSSDLSDLRHRRKFDIILIHKEHTHDSLIVCANQHTLYEDLIKDIQPRTPSKPLDGQTELKVTGFPSETSCKQLKRKIKQLANNTGGKVVSVTADYVLVHFSSSTIAERARKRMDGEDVYGSKIKVQFSSPSQDSSSVSKENLLKGKKGSPPREINNNKRNKPSPPKKLNNSSPALNPQGPSVNLEPQTAASLSVDRATSPIENIVCENQEVKESPSIPGQGLQEVVKKFTQDKKSSRQMLMLQQQIYQEEQTPICDSLPNQSTQFYSQYTKTSYTSSYYVSQQPWQPYGGCYQEKYQQKGFQNGYRSYSGIGYQNGYRAEQGTCFGNHSNNQQGFCPIRSPSPTDSVRSVSPCDPEYELEYPGATELIVSNLDYNISPREWKHILLTTFHPHVKILCITVNLQPDNTSLAFIKVGSVEEARFAISQFHRKKIGYKRIHVTLRNDEVPRTTVSIRNEAIAILLEAKGNVLPLFKFIEMYDKRYHKSISVAELYKINDTIEIREQGGAGRMVYLLPSPQRTPSPEEGTDTEVREILQQSVCSYHCPEGSLMYAEAVNSCMLPNVKLQLKTFAAQVHSLLMSHDGEIPLMTFPACYSAEVAPLVWVLEGGVPLEHLISCVPGIEIIVTKSGVKKVSWAENKPPTTIEFGQHCSSPLLTQQLNQLSRELADLLKAFPNCRLPLNKFIPSYHHHFGRQCRVADYGYTKLMELFEAVPHVVQILGTGDRKILTLTHRAQVKRFTADLLRLLKANPGRKFCASNLPEEFGKLLARPWDIIEYGVCCIEDMLAEIPASTITVTTEGSETVIGIPRKEQSPEETEKTKQFCLEVVDLLKHSHQYHMMFNKFIPSYHHHFGRQCRVSDYGFTKLQDLFDAIPHIVEVVDEGDDKYIMLTDPELRKVIGEHIVDLLKQKKVQCFPLDSLMLTFTLHYGFMIPLHDVKVTTMEELMTKLKHVLKLEFYDGKSYVVLADRSSAPPLARQVLQLLMDQSGGSLPWMELCSRYKTTFGVDPDLHKIKEELLDYVQVSGDDESAVISLTPLETLARDIRILLQVHGKVSLSQFERLFVEQFGTEIKPALYGFPTTVALLMTIPHVVTIKGKGYRRMVHLSGDLQSTLPIIDESYTRPDSDTPSNDSGSALTDDDLPPSERRKFSVCDLMTSEFRNSPCNPLISDPRQYDLLSGGVPSNVPSPILLPEMFPNNQDLMKFETPPDCRDQLFSLTEEERRQQRSPLCKTPTSELLQMAAQFLPVSVKPPTEMEKMESSASVDQSTGIVSSTLDGTKSGWWRASPAHLSETVSNPVQEQPSKAEQSMNNDQSLNQAKSHDINGTGSVKVANKNLTGIQKEADDKRLIGHDDSNNNKQDERNAKYQEENEHEDSEVKNSGNKVRVNSLSALIEHIKMENAKAKGEQYIPPKQTEEVKEIDKIEEKKNVELEEKESVARCPTPLQPGSYWYSKQFNNRPEQELPNSSSQEVRNVLASLTSKAVENKAKTSETDVAEVEHVVKTEEVSVEEGSEISQSYSTDTLAESSDDKVKTVDGSSTLEDIRLAEISESKTKDDKENLDEKQENKDNENILEEANEFRDNENETDTEKLNEGDIDNLEQITEYQDEIVVAEHDTENRAGMEIKPNEFIKEEEDEDAIAEIDDQLTEISPCEFIKTEDRRKPTEHSSHECVANDCMCYEAIFRQDHPLETSSLKSDTSFGTDSPAVSPKKQPRKRHGSQSTSSLSDGSVNSPSRPSPRRCRIAAKFESPLN